MSRSNAPGAGGPQQQQPPLSFKTVPGRNRTQKWNQAKTYNYDGDDWGGYDPYDEYGGNDDDPAARPQPQFAQASGRVHRQQSFEAGTETERRQFSGPHAPFQEERRGSPAASSSSGGHSSSNPDHDRRRMRDFSNPGQVPPPLNMRSSPVPPSGVPPRKLSAGSASPARDASPSSATTGPKTTDKPLPFIRPSDIYKRMAEAREKERQSTDSGRPSVESLSQDFPSPSGGPARANLPVSPVGSEPQSSPQRPLSTVQERPASGEHAGSNLQTAPGQGMPLRKLNTSHQPPGQTDSDGSDSVLPPITAVSDFGLDFGGPHALKPSAEDQSRGRPYASSPTSQSSATPTSAIPAPARSHAMQTGIAAPAASFADRQLGAPSGAPTSALDAEDSALHHQPSAGFRSAVRHAFDREEGGSIPATPLSRADADSVGDNFSRSNTNSTSSISPIISRVPSAATAQQRQPEWDNAVPPIAEEPVSPASASHSRSASASTTVPAQSQHQISRKPSPSTQSRVVSSEMTAPQPSYRSSLHADTPSPNNSPARTPAQETVESRRFSGPMAAEVAHSTSEPPAVDPSAPEAPSVSLEPVPTPLSEREEAISPVPDAKASAGGRGNANYSTRESDLANEASSSPEETLHPELAQQHHYSQVEFLRAHSPGAMNSPTAGGFSVRPASVKPAMSPPGSGRASPVRNRVKDIVGHYHVINESSRRNSAASLKGPLAPSARGENENASASERKATPVVPLAAAAALSRESGVGPLHDPQHSEHNHKATDELLPPNLSVRPAAGREQSFQPHLPGQWVDAAPTPAIESSPPKLALASEHDHAAPPTPRGNPVAGPGEEVDLSPTTQKMPLQGNDISQDSSNPLTAVRNAGAALGTALLTNVGFGHQTHDFATSEPAPPVDQPELRPHAPTGPLFMGHPPLSRELSDAPTESTVSVASDAPPTPPTKDNAPQHPSEMERGVPASQSYFAGAVPPPPLKLGFGGKPANKNLDEPGAKRPAVTPALSTDASADDLESDKIRKDIVRSLDSDKKDDIKRQSIMEDPERTQDALDVPDNDRRIGTGRAPAPATEPKPSDARSFLPSQAPRSGGLSDHRFSWETRSHVSSEMVTPMAAVGEAEGDHDRMSYERPRDAAQGLHVMNDEADSDSIPSAKEPHASATPTKDTTEPPTTKEGGMAELIPSPMDDRHTSVGEGSSHIPSYYIGMTDAMAGLNDENQAAAEREMTGASSTDNGPQAATTSTADYGPQPSRIPPFREILAIKATPERIRAYDDTRRTFAEMDTGLGDWLGGMLAQHNEHSGLANAPVARPPPIQTATGGSMGKGHRHSPSILKMTKQFSSNFDTSERKVSQPGGPSNVDAGERPSQTPTRDNADSAQRARGKEFIKSASVFGGKAQAGAKGLLAKGRSRFGRGGDKAKSKPAPASSQPRPHPANPSRPQATDPLPREDSSTPSSTATPIQLSSATPSLSHLLSTVPDAPDTRSADTAAGPEITYSSSPVVPSISARDVSPLPFAPSTSTPEAQAQAEKPSRRPSLLSRLRNGSRSRSRPKSRPASVMLVDDGPGLEKTSGYGRSGSRPASLILFGGRESRSQGVPSSVSAGGRREAWEAQPPPPSSQSRKLSQPSQAMMSDSGRKDAWDDDETTPRPETGRGDDSLKLGVLPSPSTNTFSVHATSPTKSEHATASAVAAATAATAATAFAGVTASPTRTQQISQGGPLMGAEDSEEEGESLRDKGAPAGVRPSYSRRVSALATLPSQMKTRQLTPSGVHAAGAEEDPFDTTPIATQRSWMALPEDSFQSPADEGITPKASAAPQEHPGLQVAPRSERFEQSASPAGEDEAIAIAGDQHPRDTEVGVEEVAPERETQPDQDRLPPSDATSRMRNEPNSDIGHSSHQSFAAPALAAAHTAPEHDEISQPASSEAWDGRSMVSAEEEQFVDARDGNAAAASRRSSVSSIGKHDVELLPTRSERNSRLFTGRERPRSGVDEWRTPRPVSSRRVMSPGPFSMAPDLVEPKSLVDPRLQRPMSGRAVAHDQMFAVDQSEHQWPTMERPMSFMPLDRDPQGMPIAEQLGQGDDWQSTPVSFGSFSGHLPGTSPYQPPPGLRSPPIDYDSIRSPVSKDEESSGLYQDTQSARATTPRAGWPSRGEISDHFGLEDAHASSLFEVAPQPEKAAKSAKRRSGIWDAFRRMPSTSPRSEFSVDDDDAPPLPADVRQEAVSSAVDEPETTALRAKTLKKRPPQPQPQQMSSAAVVTPPSEPKKKRFSGLGSIFGRSSKSQSRSAPKSNKLMKKASAPSDSPPQQTSKAPLAVGMSDGIAGMGNVGYEAYESALRRQQMPDLRRGQSRDSTSLHSNAGPLNDNTRPRTMAPSVSKRHSYAGPPAIPPGGWSSEQEERPSVTAYGPGSERYVSQQQMRQLHNGRQRRDRWSNIPVAFQPIDASFQRPFAPNRHPAELTRAQTSYGPMPGPRSRQSMGPGVVPPMPYSRSPPSTDRPFISPGQTVQSRQNSNDQFGWDLSQQPTSASDFRTAPHSRQGSGPALSPVDSRGGSQAFPPYGNLEDEFAEDHAEQQRPWTSGMSDEERSRGDSWGSSWATSPSAARQMQGQGSSGIDTSLPQRGVSSEPQTPISSYQHERFPPFQVTQRSPPQHKPVYYDVQMEDAAAGNGYTYSSAIYSPDFTYGPAQPQVHQPTQDEYSSNRPPRAIQQEDGDGRPLTYKPTTSRVPSRQGGRAGGW